jgi:hypothetical protein
VGPLACWLASLDGVLVDVYNIAFHEVARIAMAVFVW